MQITFRDGHDERGARGRRQMHTRTFAALRFATVLIVTVRRIGGLLRRGARAFVIRAGRRGFTDERSHIAYRSIGGRTGMRHGVSELTEDEPAQHQENHCPAMENEATHAGQSNVPPCGTQRSTLIACEMPAFRNAGRISCELFDLAAGGSSW